LSVELTAAVADASSKHLSAGSATLERCAWDRPAAGGYAIESSWRYLIATV